MVNKSFDKNARQQTETDEDDNLGEPIRNARELQDADEPDVFTAGNLR